MKNTLAVWGVFTFCLAVGMAADIPSEKPNFLFILVDDAGWADVSWNNAAMYTPNLQAMAEAGVILNQSYVQSVCTPSRAALLTGKYPHNIGMRDEGVIEAEEAYGLPADQVLLPQKLKTVGYDTHAIGKWHLGFCNVSFIPTRRGFDTFYGFYAGAQSYTAHTARSNGIYDFWENESILPNVGGYNTDLFTARAEEIIESKDESSNPWFIYLSYNAIHSPVTDPPDTDGDGVGDFLDNYSDPALKRTKAAAMMSYTDAAIGRIKAKLEAKGLLSNTLIVFSSDNGGAANSNFGNNWPLRGQKHTEWEAGIRTPAFVYNGDSSLKLLKTTGYTHHGMVHITDWAPTFLTMAGYDISNDGFDGVNQWDMISEGTDSNRTGIVHYMSQTPPKFGRRGQIKKHSDGVIRIGDFKLILGSILSANSNGMEHDWYEDPLHTGVPVPSSTPDAINRNGALLFNIANDPTERNDLSQLANYSSKVKELTDRLSELRSQHFVYMDLPFNTSTSANDGTNWVTGWCDSDVLLATLRVTPPPTA